jgi:phosphomannomutase
MEFLISKSGYRYIKEKMSQEKSVFGAEMTAHYFFEETHYMDNGIIPFLLVWQAVSESGKKLSELVAPYQKDHFMIDEIKFNIEDPSAVIDGLKRDFSDGKQNELDGLTIEYPDWRFNLRASNTEPVAKLNMEAKSEKLLKEKTLLVSKIIEG